MNDAVIIGGKPITVAQATAAVRSHASWLFWIAGLSFLNSIAAVLGLSYTMIVGLGVTQVIDVLALSLAQEYPAF